MSVRIRPAVAADASAIHAMIVATAAATGDEAKIRSTVDDIATHGFGPAPAFSVLLAEVDGVIGGMSLFFASYSTWRGRPGAYIQDFFVAPNLRGSGVARALMDATVATIRDRGGVYVRLSVDASNVRAQGFYRRLGFRWSDGERLFVLDGTHEHE